MSCGKARFIPLDIFIECENLLGKQQRGIQTFLIESKYAKLFFDKHVHTFMGHLIYGLYNMFSVDVIAVIYN